MLVTSSEPSAFIWASGIEDTFVPQSRPGFRPLDEYELMGHYEHWREDVALCDEIGIRALRWGVPWYRVQPARGKFQWEWVDAVLDHLINVREIEPIVDLVHYGCPNWLAQAFVDPDYPKLVAEYAAAFAQRYRDVVRWYTPLNEPLVTALMCGKRGVWPPYLRGDRGYVRVLLGVSRGILRTVAALRQLVPAAVIVHVEATGLSRAARADLEVLAIEEQHRGYLPIDLVTGRVNARHPLFGWLVRNGASPDDLARVAEQKMTIDVLGMNFYPQWSTVQLYVDSAGRLAYRAVEVDGAGFRSLIEDYHHRYRLPIMVTETSARGDVTVRSRWLTASVTAVKQLREQAIPVIGYTWFPLFTMIDWRYRFGRGPLRDYRLDLGLYTLNGPSGRWQATPLVEQFSHYVSDPGHSVGHLKGGSDAVAATSPAS